MLDPGGWRHSRSGAAQSANATHVLLLLEPSGDGGGEQGGLLVLIVAVGTVPWPVYSLVVVIVLVVHADEVLGASSGRQRGPAHGASVPRNFAPRYAGGSCRYCLRGLAHPVLRHVRLRMLLHVPMLPKQILLNRFNHSI